MDKIDNLHEHTIPIVQAYIHTLKLNRCGGSVGTTFTFEFYNYLLQYYHE